MEKIKMTIDDAIIRYNFVSKIQFKDGDNALSKDLKIKVMSMRIEYNKINKAFNDDIKEFIDGITEERFHELQIKPDRTEEETKEFDELVKKYNQEINEFVSKRSMEEIEINDYRLSEDEYAEIMETNAEKDIVINGTTVTAPDFLEILHDLFVK